jgi:hypothetical protein
MQGFLHCAADDEAVRRFGRNDGFLVGWERTGKATANTKADPRRYETQGRSLRLFGLIARCVNLSKETSSAFPERLCHPNGSEYVSHPLQV